MVYCDGKLIKNLRSEHSFYGFTGVITIVGCSSWENTRKACKSLLFECYHTGKPIESVVYWLNIPFFTKKVPPSYILSIDKWYPFHIPFLGLYIPFNCSKHTVF